MTMFRFGRMVLALIGCSLLAGCSYGHHGGQMGGAAPIGMVSHGY